MSNEQLAWAKEERLIGRVDQLSAMVLAELPAIGGERMTAKGRLNEARGDQ